MKETSNMGNLTFVTPPENQGQMVTVSYALDGETIVRRIHDASDRTSTYDRAYFPVDQPDFHPVNGSPPADLEWFPLFD